MLDGNIKLAKPSHFEVFKRMEEKRMKYEKLSKNIIEAVGGSNNIVTLQHCMTRLRFTLKDESKANDQKIEAIDGVLSLIKKGGQYQVVIGTHVHDVYLDVCQIANSDYFFFDFCNYWLRRSNYSYFSRNRAGEMYFIICINDGMGKCRNINDLLCI